MFTQPWIYSLSPFSCPNCDRYKPSILSKPCWVDLYSFTRRWNYLQERKSWTNYSFFNISTLKNRDLPHFKAQQKQSCRPQLYDRGPMWSLWLKPEERRSLYGRFMSLDPVMRPAIAPPEKKEWKKNEIGGNGGIVTVTCWHGSVFLRVLTLQLYPEGIRGDWGPPLWFSHTHTHAHWAALCVCVRACVYMESVWDIPGN